MGNDGRDTFTRVSYYTPFTFYLPRPLEEWLVQIRKLLHSLHTGVSTSWSQHQQEQSKKENKTILYILALPSQRSAYSSSLCSVRHISALGLSSQVVTGLHPLREWKYNLYNKFPKQKQLSNHKNLFTMSQVQARGLHLLLALLAMSMRVLIAAKHRAIAAALAVSEILQQGSLEALHLKDTGHAACRRPPLNSHTALLALDHRRLVSLTWPRPSACHR